MTSAPEFKKVSVSKNQQITNQNKVESKLPLTDEEAQNVINVELIPFLTNTQCLDGEVKYSGRGVFYVLYKSEKLIKKCEVGVEFSFKFECKDSNSNNLIFGSIVAENSKITSLNGIVNVSANINFSGEMLINNQVEYFEKQDDLLIKNSQNDCLKIISQSNKERKIEDEFDLPFLIGSVLSHEERVFISEVQCGIGSVIVDGEVVIDGLTTSLGGECSPSTFTKTIPFRIDIECEEALPNCISIVNGCVNNVNLKVYVDESKNKSAVNVEVNLLLNLILFEEIKCNPAVDVYSLKNKLKLNYSETNCIKELKYNCLEFTKNCKINLNLQKNSRLDSLLNVKIEKSEVELIGNNLKVEGALRVLILDDIENLTATEVFLPFLINEECDADFISCKSVVLKGYNLKNNDDDSEIEFTLKVCFVKGYNEKFKYLSSLEIGEPIKVNDSAISVYVPSEGDTLWDVCKVLCVSEKTVLDLNKELEFPLNGDERIVVYREVNND